MFAGFCHGLESGNWKKIDLFLGDAFIFRVSRFINGTKRQKYTVGSDYPEIQV